MKKVLLSLLLLFALVVPSNAVEQLGTHSYQLFGRDIPVYLFYNDKDGKYGLLAEGGDLACISKVVRSPVASQPPLVFAECANGWELTLGEWGRSVVVYRSGSGRQEVVRDDSVFAWWCRTVLRHAAIP